MAWTKLASATNNSLVNHVTLTVVSGAAVSIGDTINVSVQFGDAAGVPASSVVTDNLANTYVNKSRVRDASNFQTIETWVAFVTVAGTPTVQVQYNPTPGTTQATNCSLNVDPFTGSNASSVSDGANAQLQTAPGTVADAVSSGNFSPTPTVNGDLIYGAFVDTTSGAAPGTNGTGFSTGIVSGGVVLQSEFKTQVTAGAVAVTFTATTGGDNSITAGHAVTPAVVGGVPHNIYVMP
jgi:hypothetical protein